MRALGGLLEHGSIPSSCFECLFLGWVCKMLIIGYYVHANLLHDFQAEHDDF